MVPYTELALSQPLSLFFFSLIYFIIFGFEVPGGTQGLLLSLCAGITPSRLWGPYVLPGIEPRQLLARPAPYLLYFH